MHELVLPRYTIVPIGPMCESSKHLNISSLRDDMITGKRVEHMNEVLISQKFKKKFDSIFFDFVL